MITSKKKLFSIMFLIVFHTLLFSHENPAIFTKKAIDLLESAVTAVVSTEWTTADSIATIALEYDSSIADFYYIKALCAFSSHKMPYEIIPLLEKSLDDSHSWYKYNQLSARLFLAKQLSIVKQSEEALELLNQQSPILVPDALLERVKIYYSIDDISLARETALYGATLYPYDYRFDEAFYIGELNQVNNQNTIDYSSKYIQFFNKRVNNFSEQKPELLLFSSVFIKSIEEKKQVLKTYNAQNNKHPLYALYAMNANLLTQIDAFNYIEQYFSEISYNILIDFIHAITDNAVQEKIIDYFNEYNGTLLFDLNGDTYTEMKVAYAYGRPSFISYDENQDGLLNWELRTDYGMPKNLTLIDSGAYIEYSSWPVVSSITENTPTKKNCVYNLVDNSLSFTVVDFTIDSYFEEIGLDFFIPVVKNTSNELEKIDIFNASYTIDFNTVGVENGRTRFTLLDGEVKNALYTQNSTPYAYAYFNNGLLVSRNVDRDNNGTFEVVEKYSYSEDANYSKQKLIDEVVGFEHLAENLYLQSIFVDLDDNSIFEFSQEYFPDGSTVTSWNRDADGLWLIRTIQKLHTQELQYYNPISGQIKSIVLKDTVPISIGPIEILKDSKNNFYWLGESFHSSIAEQLIAELNNSNTPESLVVSDKLWNAEKQQFLRIVCVKNGDMYFGEAFYE